MSRKRKIVFTGLIAVLLVAAYAVTTENSGKKTAVEGNETWKNTEFEDVNSGDKFSLNSFEKPVLVETFAVWCSTCTRQQNEVKKLHEDRKDFVSVSLNTDPNEDASKIKAHAERHGFSWKYAIADAEVSRSLRNEFDSSILTPPLAPMVMVCPNGSFRRLPNGVKPASKLSDEIDKGC